MPNRLEKYETPDGFLFNVLVPEDAPTKNLKYGLRVGPPDLSSMKLPKEVERRLNNALYHRGLITLADTKRRRGDVLAAWQSVLGADVVAIISCYSKDQ